MENYHRQRRWVVQARVLLDTDIANHKDGNDVTCSKIDDMEAFN
jgi:hypothetical protein